MAEVNAIIIKKTQEKLGKFIKKPQLTEKLLKKPPFRFLHDIIIAVTIFKINFYKIRRGMGLIFFTFSMN